MCHQRLEKLICVFYRLYNLISLCLCESLLWGSSNSCSWLCLVWNKATKEKRPFEFSQVSERFQFNGAGGRRLTVKYLSLKQFQCVRFLQSSTISSSLDFITTSFLHCKWFGSITGKTSLKTFSMSSAWYHRRYDKVGNFLDAPSGNGNDSVISLAHLRQKKHIALIVTSLWIADTFLAVSQTVHSTLKMKLNVLNCDILT